MEFRCTSTPASSWSGDTLAVGLFSGSSGPLKAVLEERFGAALLERLAQRQFKGKTGESLRFEWLGATPSVLLVVGLGDPAEFGLDGARKAAANIAKAAQGQGCTSLGIALPVEGLEPQAAAAAIAQAGVTAVTGAGGDAGKTMAHGVCLAVKKALPMVLLAVFLRCGWCNARS